MMILALSGCSNPFSKEEPKTVTELYYADTPDDEYSFEPTTMIDGQKYILDNTEYKVVSHDEAELGEISDFAPTKDAYEVGSEFTFDDIVCEVKDVKVSEQEVTLKRTVSTKEPDEAISKKYKEGKKTIELVYTLDNVKKADDTWKKGGTFEFNIVGYGGSYYDIGNGTHISSTNTLADIQKQQKSVLAAEGLDANKTKISKVEWKNSAYTNKNGIKCRDAVITYQTKQSGYTATYKSTLYRFDVKYLNTELASDVYHMEAIGHYKRDKSNGLKAGKVAAILVILGALAGLAYLGYTYWGSSGEIKTINGVEYDDDDY